MDQHKKILGVEDRTQTSLSLSHAVHQGPALLGLEVAQSGTPRSGTTRVCPGRRGDVEEGVPALTACHGVGRKATLDDALEQRRLAHERAWSDADFNPHADSVGARTQCPETPLRTARVSVVPSEETKVWCI